MLLRVVVIAVLLLTAASQYVAAQVVMGAGMISCGEWLQFRTAQANQGNVQQIGGALQAEAWIDGFLSGVNVGSSGGLDFLKSQPNGFALNAWVDNYCRSKPLDPIVAAANALVNDLRSRVRP